MEKWEYKLEKVSHEDLTNAGGAGPFLNDRGADGWELVAIQQASDGTEIIWSFIFKRPIDSDNDCEKIRMQRPSREAGNG